MNNIIELGKGKITQGKAGNLNKLYKEFNISRGFIISNDIFNEFIKLNNISLDSDISKIRNQIINGTFPREEELLKYFKNEKYKKVIVRSSASLEDGEKYSFAGQFNSYANVDINTLIISIKKCWASKYNDNIISYLEDNKLSMDFSFDIIVQEMINSTISGIAFSINPTNGKEETLINITKSQCEELVDGRVIPQTYHIKEKTINDKYIEKKKLIIINRNLQKLKGIFKKEVEIEFCFKEETFYLFQVRPITKTFFSLNDYINSEYWCSFKNNNWTLFNRSLWILGATKYKNKRIKNDVTEDITIYYPNNQKQVRAFNGNQPPLDKETISDHSEKDIKEYINKFNNYSKKINIVSKTIKKNIVNNDYKNFNKNLKKIIKYNAIMNSYEYLIGSLGQALYNSLDYNTKNKIEKWRNSEQNSYFPIYDDIFKYIVNYFNINIDTKTLKMYIHVNELLNLCNNKITKATIQKRIAQRKKIGFVLLNLHNKKYCNKVVINKSAMETVNNKFNEIQNNIIKDNKSNGVIGQSTLKNGKIIIGECVVIRNEDISNIDLKNKILICPITTAKDVKYLKNIKALIVDSGGVLCHSAIFSREYNIPCLMGCVNATEYFNTGEIVSYNIDEEKIEKI